MTTLDPQEVICTVCSQSSEQLLLTSTNSFGASDLDLRPSEMMRSTLPSWVQVCPHCYYCARDLSNPAPPQFREYVKAKDYLAQFHDTSYPELARIFLCCSLLEALTEKENNAGWSALHAAWVCDDVGKADLAVDCREKAIVQFQKARHMGKSFCTDPDTEDALLTDLFRRCGMDEQARMTVQERLAQKPSEIIAQILAYQIELVAKGDRSAHCLDEIK